MIENHQVRVTTDTLTERLLYAKHCLNFCVLTPQPYEIHTFIITILQMKTPKRTESTLPGVTLIGSSGAVVCAHSLGPHCQPGQPGATVQGWPSKNKRE